jgi:hypothetical protein
MTMHYVSWLLEKLIKINVDILCKMALRFGKTNFLIAYDLQSKRCLYETVSTEKNYIQFQCQGLVVLPD